MKVREEWERGQGGEEPADPVLSGQAEMKPRPRDLAPLAGALVSQQLARSEDPGHCMIKDGISSYHIDSRPF